MAGLLRGEIGRFDFQLALDGIEKLTVFAFALLEHFGRIAVALLCGGLHDVRNDLALADMITDGYVNHIKAPSHG